MSIDRKALILRAAAQSFVQFGYKATTMDLVSKIANVGKGTIYTFFSTKEELFDEILAQAFDELTIVMKDAIKPEATLMHNLLCLLDAMLEFRSDHELFLKLTQEVRDIGTQQALQGIRMMEKFSIAFLKQHLDDAVEKGEMKPCDTDITAYMILRLYLAITTEWDNTHEQPLTKEQIKEHLTLFVVDGILQEKG